MSAFKHLSLPQQVALHLEKQIESGSLQKCMPGVVRLEKELEVNRKTIELALQILEAKGILIAQGAGKQRLIPFRFLFRLNSLEFLHVKAA